MFSVSIGFLLKPRGTTHIQVVYSANVKNSKWDKSGIKFIPWVVYTTMGYIHIWVSVVEPTVDPDVHLIFKFLGAFQWNGSVSSRFYLHRV